MSLILPVESQVFLGIIINYIIHCNCSKMLLKSFCFSSFSNFGSTQHAIAHILDSVVFIFHNMSVFLTTSAFAVYLKLYFQVCCMYILLFFNNCAIFALYWIYIGWNLKPFMYPGIIVFFRIFIQCLYCAGGVRCVHMVQTDFVNVKLWLTCSNDNWACCSNL
jgi:hypothetical protein